MAALGNSVVTKNLTTTHTLTWKIEDFLKVAERVTAPNGAVIYHDLTSPTLQTGDKFASNWKIRLHYSPPSSAIEYNGSLSVLISLTGCTAAPDVNVSFRCSVAPLGGAPVTNKDNPTKNILNKSPGEIRIGSSSIAADIRYIVNAHTVEVRCEVSFTEAVSASSKNPAVTKSNNPFFDIFTNMFESMELSDLVISTKDGELKAHKLLLSMRSTVFKAMFAHELKENAEGRVDLKDYDSKVIREMLRYVYTDKVEDLNLVACDLLPVADKYDLAGLKELCLQELQGALCADNAVALLQLAELYRAPAVRARALKFIHDNMQQVMKTSQWQTLKQQPQLLMEICDIRGEPAE